MKFKDILPDLLNGFKVRRRIWNDMYLIYDINNCTIKHVIENTVKECSVIFIISEMMYDDWEVIKEDVYKCTIENIINDMSGAEPIKRAAWYNSPTKLLIPIQSWEDMEEYIDTFDKDEVQSINIYCYDNNIYVGCKLTDEDLNATDWCMFEME